MSKNWSEGSTYEWRKTRAKILERANYQCEVRLEGICTEKASHVHHTRGRHITGDNPKWLVASCPECNQSIGDPSKKEHDPSPIPQSKW